MNLDNAQKSKVTEWIGEGLKLSEIQNRLAAEFGLRLTYMDVRFLIDDLKLKLKDAEPPRPPPTLGPAPGEAAPPGTRPPQPVQPLQEEGAPPGNVAVTVDQIAKPGAVVSGSVRFSDGKSATWYLDQFGRLGLAAEQQGYRPSQEDLMEFQSELQSQLAKLGY